MSASVKTKMPVLYISHGGGPCFFMDWSPIGPADTWNKTADWLKNLSRTFPTPQSIVVISAHWEEDEFTVMSTDAPDLIYDYYGFPKHTYELTYPAPGSSVLAARVQDLLQKNSIPMKTNSSRGFDHGVFIPFKLIYPDASIPIIQVSLKKNMSIQDHLDLGKALSPLRDEGVLMVGSGMSYHNLKDLFRGNDVLKISKEFDQWLNEAISDQSSEARAAKLLGWESAPHARQAHPREEHLMPLMVISGAGEDESGRCVFSDQPMGAVSSGFQFG